MAKQKDLVRESMIVNNATMHDYSARLKLLATSLFKYDKLDDYFGDYAARFLENTLFGYGKACFVKDPQLGFIVCKVSDDGKKNIYNMPTKVKAHNDGYEKIWDLEEVVYIMNNDMQLPTRPTIDLFAYRLYDVQRTMDINLQSQKTPILIEGDKNNVLTLQNLYHQYSGNTPVLFGNKAYDFNSKLNVIKTDAPYLLDKLTIYKHEIWNECLTFLGIDNANTDKNRIVLTPEIESNDELIGFYLNCFYSTRKRAVDELNKRWNLDIKLEINREAISELLEKMKEEVQIEQLKEIQMETENE